MRVVVAMVLAALMEACASNPPEGTIAVALVDDFVAAAALEQTDRIERITALDGWKPLNDRYVIFYIQDGDYLLHLKRRCYSAVILRSHEEVRWMKSRLRIPYDQLAGCQIETIYKLAEGQAQELNSLISDEQAQELRGLSDAPGRGNK